MYKPSVFARQDLSSCSGTLLDMSQPKDEQINNYVIDWVCQSVQEVLEVSVKAGSKPGYEAFRTDFESITHNAHHIRRAVHNLELIMAGKPPADRPPG